MSALRKLRSRRGETLTETLAATLVIALAILMMAGMVASAIRIDAGAREADEKFYEELSRAEGGGGYYVDGGGDDAGDTDSASSVTLTNNDETDESKNVEIKVALSGTEGGLTAYHKPVTQEEGSAE